MAIDLFLWSALALITSVQSPQATAFQADHITVPCALPPVGFPSCAGPAPSLASMVAAPRVRFSHRRGLGHRPHGHSHRRSQRPFLYGPPIISYWDPFFWPPFGLGYSNFVPSGWGPTQFVFAPPPVVVVPPPVMAMPDARFDIRGRGAAAVPARLDAETEIPMHLVDQLVPRNRPTLAQRAQSARLEGGGDRVFRAGHFQRAAERYEQALAQAPDHDELHFKRDAALIAAGNFDEAGRTIRDALRERPDWPFAPHDLRQLFPDDDAIRRTIEALQREARKPNADPDVPFLEAYVLYFSGQREAAEPIFRNPPEGGSVRHFQLFVDAIDRRRGGR